MIVISRGDKNLTSTYTQVIACVLADNERRKSSTKHASDENDKRDNSLAGFIGRDSDTEIPKNMNSRSSTLSRIPSVNNNQMRTVVIRESGPTGGLDCRIRDYSSPNGRREYEATVNNKTPLLSGCSGCCAKAGVEGS